jgi:hypothetical protein
MHFEVCTSLFYNLIPYRTAQVRSVPRRQSKTNPRPRSTIQPYDDPKNPNIFFFFVRLFTKANTIYAT